MNASRLRLFVPVGLLGLIFVSCAAAQVQAPGVPNFHQVSELIYRGAQPGAEGWKSLATLGVKTVIDLRRENEDGEHSVAAERKAVEAAGMRYVNVPLNGLAAPRDRDVERILELFASGDRVFVHCRRGKDRTGTAIACYRIAHDGWGNAKALNEAKSFGLHWVEVGMRRYIAAFQPALPRTTPAATVATNE